MELASLANGQEYYRFKRERLGDDIEDYSANVTVKLVETVSSRIDPTDYVVLKTHGLLTPELEEMIDNGVILAFSSFRDPRDSILSTLDAGATAREKGLTCWFTGYTEIEQLINPMISQFNITVPWAMNSNVLCIPYYLTVLCQSPVVEILAAHLNYGWVGRFLAETMDGRKASAPEWNKGIADRYIEQLTADQIAFLNEKFAGILPTYDGLLRMRMGALRHSMLCENLLAERDARLAQKLKRVAA